MKTWTRAQMAMRCGACPRTVDVGEPYLAIQITGMQRTLRRCEFCAGGAPPDLPPHDAELAHQVAEIVEIDRYIRRFREDEGTTKRGPHVGDYQ